MTLVEVLEIVKEHTGETVTPETQLSSLGMDSLDFLDLMVAFSIPDVLVPSMNTVGDLQGPHVPPALRLEQAQDIPEGDISDTELDPPDEDDGRS
jgi:acyl carrier protein